MKYVSTASGYYRLSFRNVIAWHFDVAWQILVNSPQWYVFSEKHNTVGYKKLLGNRTTYFVKWKTNDTKKYICQSFKNISFLFSSTIFIINVDFLKQYSLSVVEQFLYHQYKTVLYCCFSPFWSIWIKDHNMSFAISDVLSVLEPSALELILNIGLIIHQLWKMPWNNLTLSRMADNDGKFLLRIG